MQRHRGRVDELNKWASWALQYYEEEQRRTGELDDAWWPLDEQGERLWGDPPGLSNGALDKSAKIHEQPGMVLWGGCPFKHTASLWGGVQTPQVDVLLLWGGCPPPRGCAPSFFGGGGALPGLPERCTSGAPHCIDDH